MKRMIKVGRRVVEYQLVQSARRDFLLKALPEGKISLFAPRVASLKVCDEVVCKNIDSIDQAHARMDYRQQQKEEASPLTTGGLAPYRGRMYRMTVEPSSQARVEVGEDTIVIYAPDTSYDALSMQWRSEMSRRALPVFREKILEYAPRMGVKPGRVTIREQKTRWGSCSSRDNLNFNWKLILAPDEVLTYVVIHELAHLIEFNHSPRFWAQVQSQMPDYEHWKKWLKTNAPALEV